MQLQRFDYDAFRSRLLAGEVTAEATVRDCLDRVEKGRHLNAMLSVLHKPALDRARHLDQRVRDGEPVGSLAGMVAAVKDLLCLKGVATTCGSGILANFEAPYSATSVQRLEAEDAIIVGKTNLDEFAMGSSNENSAFGPAKNPHDTTRTPGGSSGGSAAAVAGGLVPVALGTDTGGSIRQPAAFCGVVGLKPTYGTVSRYGLAAFASSLDQIGPMATNVADCARLLEVISGHDPHDSTSAPRPEGRYMDSVSGDVSKMRIGVPQEYLSGGVQPEILDAVNAALDLFRQGGAEVVDVQLPHTEYAIATYYIIATAEASSNLARYDGARYGVRADDPADLQEMYRKSRDAGFGSEVKRRIMLGTYVLSAGYYDAYYLKAQKARTLIKRDFDEAFSKVDCLLTPTTPTTAFKLGEKVDDPLTMYLSDIFTVSMNLAGLPAISLPVGRDAQGLPIGLQVVANQFEEGRLFRAASYLEAVSGYA